MSRGLAQADLEQEAFRPVAVEVLDAFEGIALAAANRLGQRGQHAGALANYNQATADQIQTGMQARNAETDRTCETLLRQPAIARLVVSDENDREETLYFTATGTVTPSPVSLCSYYSPMGRLASVSVGDGDHIRLPDGSHRWFTVLEKLEFTPTAHAGLWDSQPAVRHREELVPLTIRSLRSLLTRHQGSQQPVDEWAVFFGETGDAEPNVAEGLKRNALQAMGIRVKALLDAVQDRIMRLPLNSRIAVLGPPGTGKTTTLIKRLRHKITLLDEPQEQEGMALLDAVGNEHASSWVMFSPTALLRAYVREAFGRADIPVHDERLHVWSDYSRAVARRSLGILSDGRSNAGFVPIQGEALLLPETLVDQIAWFEAFNNHQRDTFVRQLKIEADRLSCAEEDDAARLGQRVVSVLDRQANRPLSLLAELVGLYPRLREAATAGREEISRALTAPLRAFSEGEPLQALIAFVEQLGSDEAEDEDEQDGESDDDLESDGDAQPRQHATARRAAGEAVVRAMRARAIAQASGRSVAAGSRARRLLDWMVDRGVVLPDLRKTGAALLVRRAAQRLARAPLNYPGQISRRYRLFRRAMRDQGSWYAPGTFRSREITAAEIDLMLLLTLRLAGDMERDAVLSSRLGGRSIPTLERVRQLRRNQVLVDEVSDFSPVQLACMRELVDPRTGALFLSGDFNQRLTSWGTKSLDQLRWAASDVQVESLGTSYRQTRALAAFAGELGAMLGYDIQERAPEHLENEGFPPVFATALATIEAQAAWLASRIAEVNDLTDGALPTVAVLVCDAASKQPLADALSAQLADMSIRAVACSEKERGLDGDVRIFEVEHVKGLEFEAVFFMGLDALEARESDLFSRFLYVGATRAATFLGMTLTGNRAPDSLGSTLHKLPLSWSASSRA